MNLAPIVLFTYNRYWHTKKTVEALLSNHLSDQSELIIFSDAPKNEETAKIVYEIRNYLKSINGFKCVTIIERERNYGLANNIMDGVSQIVNKFGKVIVLEDDLVTSPYFLDYMNKALDIYKDNDKVISVHGYMYPVKEKLPETFFLKGADCWGWATWKRGWDIFDPDGEKLLQELEAKGLCKEFDFNNSFPYTKMLKDQIIGKNNSWAIRWYASAFLKDKFTLYPGISLVRNIGNDLSGTHFEDSKVYDVTLEDKRISEFAAYVEETKIAKKSISNYFKMITKYKRVKKFLNLITFRWL